MKSKKIFSLILSVAVITGLFISTPAKASTITVAPASTYGITYEGQVQNKGWMSPAITTGDQYATDLSNVSISGTVHLGLRVEAVKITGTNLPKTASITYQGQVQNIGWQAPVTTTGNVAIDSASMAGTQNQGLRVEAFKMTLNGLPGYAVEYQTQVQNKGWMTPVQTVNDTDITGASMAGTQNQGLRMEALRIEIVKTSAEKTAEVNAINAITTAESSKATTDIATAKTAIASVEDVVEQTTLTTDLTDGTPVVIPPVVIPVAPVTPVTPVTPVNPNLNSIVDIDSPSDNQTITSSSMTLTGWALDAAGIRGISVDVDDNPINSVGCSVPRPDVQKLFPQYNTLTSGYTQSEDITNLSNGIHTMTVTVDGKDGKSSTATRKINVQLPSASHENTALEKGINPDSDFTSSNNSWDFTAINTALDSISAQYLNNKITSAQAQQEMYAYSVNVTGHPNTRVSKVYFTTNTTSETGSDGVSMFTYSGGYYNKCKIWMNTNGTNTITTIGADVTSN